jgi:hypothetical protein
VHAGEKLAAKNKLLRKDESPTTILDAITACRQSFDECLPMGNLVDKKWAENLDC